MKVCKIGEMGRKSGGYYSNLEGTFYPHICNQCKFEETFKNQSFPYTINEYEEHEMITQWDGEDD